MAWTKMSLPCKALASAVVILFVHGSVSAQQMADPNFQARVERPAFTKNHPRVVIDEAHANFHTPDGRYKPLADLLSRLLN